MAKRAVEVIFQVPFLKTLFVEDVQTLEFADLLIPLDLIETDGAESLDRGQPSRHDLPVELTVRPLRRSEGTFHVGPELLQGANGGRGVQFTQLLFLVLADERLARMAAVEEDGEAENF